MFKMVTYSYMKLVNYSFGVWFRLCGFKIVDCWWLVSTISPKLTITLYQFPLLLNPFRKHVKTTKFLLIVPALEFQQNDFVQSPLKPNKPDEIFQHLPASTGDLGMAIMV